MDNKSCLICAWREFCSKKEIIEARYCPDFTFDVKFLKKDESLSNKLIKDKEDENNKSTDSK